MWHIAKDTEDIFQEGYVVMFVLWPNQFEGSRWLRKPVELWCGKLFFNQSAITFEDKSDPLTSIDVVFNGEHL